MCGKYAIHSALGLFRCAPGIGDNSGCLPAGASPLKKIIVPVLLLSCVLSAECGETGVFERFFLAHPDFMKISVMIACVAVTTAIIIFRFVPGPESWYRSVRGYWAERSPKKTEDEGHLKSAAVKTANLTDMHTSKKYSVPPSGELTIGRSFSNTVVLESASVSRVHAKIVLEEGEYVIYDLDSKRGTLVSGEKIKKKVLKDGDLIEIGREDILFSIDRD